MSRNLAVKGKDFHAAATMRVCWQDKRGFDESLNGKFRAECLNANWFLSLDEARRKCDAWRRDYNEVRPHSAIGNQVPAMLHRSAGNPGQAAIR